MEPAKVFLNRLHQKGQIEEPAKILKRRMKPLETGISLAFAACMAVKPNGPSVTICTTSGTNFSKAFETFKYWGQPNCKVGYFGIACDMTRHSCSGKNHDIWLLLRSNK